MRQEAVLCTAENGQTLISPTQRSDKEKTNQMEPMYKESGSPQTTYVMLRPLRLLLMALRGLA